MPCTSVSYEEMAEAGLTDDEIELLKKEVELARAVAQAEAFRDGLSQKQQQRNIEQAETDARAVAHDRFHAKLRDMSDQIAAMALWQKAHPGQHYDPTNERVAVTATTMLNQHRASESAS